MLAEVSADWRVVPCKSLKSLAEVAWRKCWRKLAEKRRYGRNALILLAEVVGGNGGGCPYYSTLRLAPLRGAPRTIVTSGRFVEREKAPRWAPLTETAEADLEVNGVAALLRSG